MSISHVGRSSLTSSTVRSQSRSEAPNTDLARFAFDADCDEVPAPASSLAAGGSLLSRSSRRIGCSALLGRPACCPRVASLVPSVLFVILESGWGTGTDPPADATACLRPVPFLRAGPFRFFLAFAIGVGERMRSGCAGEYTRNMKITSGFSTVSMSSHATGGDSQG